MIEEMRRESDQVSVMKSGYDDSRFSFDYMKGKVIYIPELIPPKVEVKLGFESVWMMPENTNELGSAVYLAASALLPLRVAAPEWIGVSHDTGKSI